MMVRIYAYSRNFGVKNVHNLKKNQNYLFFDKNKPCWGSLQKIPDRCTLGWLRFLPSFLGGGRFLSQSRAAFPAVIRCCEKNG